MTEKFRRTRRRPFVIFSVTVTLIVTAIIPVILILAGITVLAQRGNSTVAVCYSIFMILGGLWGVGFFVWLAWAFYGLNPYAYQLVKSFRWSPLFWLATGFGKRLDDPDVREAFGLSRVVGQTDPVR